MKPRDIMLGILCVPTCLAALPVVGALFFLAHLTDRRGASL